MEKYDSLTKSTKALEVDYKKVNLDKYPDKEKQIETFRKASLDAILKVAKEIKEDIKSEAKKAVIPTVAIATAANTLLGGAALAKGLKPVELKENQNVIEDINTMDLQVAYKSFCISIINEVKREYNLFDKSDEQLYKTLAEVANNTSKGKHDFLIGSYGYLYGYNSDEFRNIMNQMNGYNYGITDPEKIKDLYYKSGGFDFQTKHIDFEELEKYCLSYYKVNFHRYNIKDFKMSYVLNTEPVITGSLSELTEEKKEDNLVIDDLKQKAEDILSDSTKTDIKLYTYYMLHDESELNKLLETMSYIEENKNYKTLEEYVQDRGFEDIAHWNSYVLSMQEEMVNGRGM